MKMTKKAFKPFCIDCNRPVGACARFPARGIGVVASPLFGGGVVGDHWINVSAVHQKGKSRSSEPLKIVIVLGLWDNADLIPRVLQHPWDYRRAKAGVIDIRVPRDYYNIGLFPAVLPLLLNGYR